MAVQAEEVFGGKMGPDGEVVPERYRELYSRWDYLEAQCDGFNAWIDSHH